MSEGLVDERVVEMRFDNAQFEQNVNQSIKTINKLKDSLDFENAGESFENISAAAAKCDMKPLEESLDGITVKFNMLEMVAANVLGRIVNQVIDAGAKMAKSLTVDQINAGWSKYAQKTESVQTIMSATGESIDYVNSRLEKLIWFADETSYDFVDMVNNIGKFTSAGVDLDDAVDSMMGISNWAAASGAGIQQASRAMYNLSQAMGMGYVGLTDWRSIELANMATEEFKETVIATALDLGTLKQEANGVITTLDGKDIVSAENMRSSLKKGWFTGDVLTTALKEYNEFSNIVYDRQKQWAEENNGEYITVSQTLKVLEKEGAAMDTLGARAFQRAQEATTFNQAIAATADAVSTQWMKTFELIFGNYEQAKKLWTELSNDLWDIFAGPGESRNESLKSILDSNYKKMIDEMPDPEEMNARLFDKLQEMTKNNRGEAIAESIFAKYDSLEQLLQNENYTGATLRTAFKSIADDYTKEADNAAKLSKTLKSGQLTLKQAAVRLSGGIYGKEVEQQRKVVEEMGFNYEELLEYAQMWEAGVQVDWDAAQKGMIKNLDKMEQYYRGFAEKVKKISPLDEFLQSLSEISGREKLIGGFQNIFKSVKNIYLTITAIADGISSLFGSGSFLGGLIDGFYNLTSWFAITDDMFEGMSEDIYDFFNGGIQKLWHDFWYGSDDASAGKHFDALTGDYERVSKHIPGALEKINDAYEMYIGRLPERIQNSLNTIKNKITGFFGGVPKEVKDLFEKVFGHFEKAQILTNNGSINTLIHVGGIFEDLKTKVSNFMSSTGGTIFNGLIKGLKKIADYLFGYETETGVVEGKIIGIYDKVNEFINKIKTIGKSFHEFLFGKDFKDRTVNEQLQHIPGLIDNIKTSIKTITDSDAYKSIHRFIFGEKDADGNPIKKNIFGKIGTAIKTVTDSEAYKSIHRFIFGEKDADGNPIKKNIFGKIGTAIKTVTDSEAYKSIYRFIFGEKDADGNPIKKNIFGKIGTAIKTVTDSAAYKSIYRFIFGGGEEQEPNIFYKIKNSVQDIFDSPAFQAIHDFIFGKKVSQTGTKNSVGKFITKEQMSQMNLLERFVAVAQNARTFLFGYDYESINLENLEEGIKHVDGVLDPVIRKIKEIGASVLVAINNFRKWLGLDWEMTDDGLVRIPGALDKIGEAAEWVKQKFSELPTVVLDFFLGPVNEEGKRTENLFKRLPGYFEKAKNGILDFFLGKKKFVTKSFTDKNGNEIYFDDIVREGNLLERLKEKFDSLRSAYPWFDSFCNFIETQLKKIRKIFTDANGSISETFVNLKKYLFGYDVEKKSGIFGLSTEIEHVNGVVDNIKDSISNLFNSKKNKDKSLIDYILDFLGLNHESFIGKLRNIVLSLAGINIALSSFKIGKGKFTLVEYKNGLDTIVEAISEIIDSFKELAISLAILAGTFLVVTTYLHYMNFSRTEMIRAGLVLIGLGAGLYAFALIMSKISDDLSIWSVLTIRTIADAITQLTIVGAAVAFFVKKTGSGEEFKMVIPLLSLLILAIGVAGSLMMKDGKDIKTAAGSFLGFAAILHEFTTFLFTAMISIGGIYILLKKGLIDQDTLIRAFIYFLGILTASIAFMAGIAAVQAIVNKTASKINFSTFLSMVGLFETAKSMILLVSGVIAGIYIVLERNKSRDANGNAVYDTSTLNNAFGGMVAVLIVVVGFMYTLSEVMNKTAQSGNIHISKFLFIFTLLGFIGAIAKIAVTTALAAKGIGWENMAVTLAGISVLILASAGVAKTLGEVKRVDKTSFASLLFMWTAIASFALLVGTFNLLNIHISDFRKYAELMGAIALIAPVLLEFSWVFNKINKLGNFSWNTLLVIVMMDAVIIAFGGVVATLNWFASKITNVNALKSIYIAISLIGPLLLEFAGVFWVINKISNFSKNTPIVIGAMIIFIGLLGGLVWWLSWLSKKAALGNSYDAILPMLAAIGEVAGAMVGLSLIISLLGVVAKIPTFKSGIVVAVEMLVAIGVLAMAVWGLAAIANKADIHTYDAILPMLAAIGEVAGAMVILSGIIALLGVVGGIITPLLIPAVVAIAAVTGGVILIGAAFIAMEKALQWISEKAGDESIVESVNSVMETMVAIMHGIGEMIGALIGGIGEGISGSLPEIGTNLSDFMTSLQPFLSMIQELNEAHTKGALILTGIMTTIVADEVLGAIAALIENFGPEGGMLQVAQNMGTFMTALSPFLGSICTLNEAHITGAGYLTGILGEIVKEEILGAIASLIEKFSDNGPITMAQNMSNFLTSLQPFLNGVLTLTEAHLAGAALLTLILTSILIDNALTWLSTLIDSFTEDSIRMAENLAGFVVALQPFLNNVLTITQDHVNGAKFLTGVMKEITKQKVLDAIDNIIKYFTGETNYQSYVDNLVILASGVVTMNSKLAGIDQQTVEKDISIIKSILDLVTDNNYKSGGLAGMFDSLINGTTDFKTLFTKLNDEIADGFVTFAGKVSTIDVQNAEKAASILPSIMDMLTNKNYRSGGISGFFTDLVSGSDTNYAGMFDALNTKILPGLRDFAKGVNALDEDGNSIDYSNIDSAANAVKSVMDIMTMDTSSLINDEAKGWWIFKEKDTGASRLADSFEAIKNTVVPAISSLQDALLEKNVSADYVQKTIGAYSSLIQTLTEFKDLGLSSEDVSNIGEYIITGLVNALDNGVTQVQQAAERVAAGITEGLTLTLEIHSPSKVAFEIGQFITEGLTNGLRAGEPLTWDMARQFGEGTIEALMEGAKKYDSYGLTKHAINMVTSDLVDENIFNMPDFTEIDRFGNEVQNFEKMEDYLKEKFGGTFDNSYIEGFIGSMKKAASEVPQVINDADYANMMVNIAEGDFGFGQDAIIDSLTKELGDVNAATQAWQDYTDVLAGNIEINKDLLKQRKQNPPMTEEQWMAMYAWDKEGFDKANRGEFHDLAAANGTTWQEEAAKRGYDPKRIQAGFNAQWWNSESYYELYIKNLAELELAQESAKNIGEQSALSVVGASQEVTEAVEATTEAIAENAETVKDIPHNYQDATIELEKQAEMHQEVAKAAEESAEAAVAAGEETTDAFDYNAWEKAVKKASSGVYNLTEAEQKLLMLGREETITKGTFGIGVGTSGWANNMKKLAKGLSDEEAKWAADFANWYGNSDQTLEEYIKAHNTLYSATDSVTSASGDASNAMVENFSDAYDQLDDKSQNFFTKLSERMVEGVKNGTKNLDITDLLKDIGYTDNTKQMIKLDDIFGSDSGLSLEDKINYLSDPKRLAGSVLSNIGSVEDFTGNLTEVIKSKDILKEVVDIFTDPKGVKAGFLNKVGDVILETFGLANKEADELSEKEIAPKVDNSGLASFNAYLDEIYKKYELLDNGRIAKDGSVNLQNGEKVTSKQAAELQKVWDMAMMGAYGNSFKDISDKLAEMGIDYASLFQLSSGGKIDWSQYTDDVTAYADKVKKLGSDYTINDLITDSNAGKFGETMAERKKAYELAGLDADKAEALFQEYLKKGPEALENIGDDYAKLSDAELEAKKKAEEYNEVLNTTPQGAFRAISDFLENVTKVIDDDESADKFRGFIDSITGPLQDFNVDKASEFEKIAGFLNAVRNSARESTAIAKDFAAFVDGIDSSIEKLGSIKIENTDAMDRVKEFLNGIKIENKETLDTVAAFIQSIVSFAEGSASSGDYATQLSATITTMVNDINSLPDIDTKKTEPLTNFIDKLTAGLGLLQKDDSNTVRAFLTNFYAAFESSENQAQTAAGTIANAVISKLRFYYNTLKAIGRRFTEEFAKGIESRQSRATTAGQTIAGAVMASLREGTIDKASETSSEFITSLVTGLQSEESKQKIKDALGNLFSQGPEEETKEPEKDVPHNYKDGSLIEPEEKQPENTETPELTTGGSQQGLKYGQEFLTGLSSAIQNGSGTISGSLTSMFAGVTAGADAFGSIAETAQTSLNSLATTLTGILENDEEGSLVDAVGKLKGLMNGIFPDGRGKADAMIAGMIEGLAAGSKKVSYAMRLLSKGIVFTVDQVMQINSPSKVMRQRGLYIMEGWAEGLHTGSRDVYREMNNTAEGSLSNLSSAIKTALDTAENSLSSDPVIRPVVDLSEVYNAASAIDAELSTDKAVGISTAERNNILQNGSDPQQAAGTQIFNQYNYSPKPLSRADIYRQTKNQFAMLKGANQVAV